MEGIVRGMRARACMSFRFKPMTTTAPKFYHWGEKLSAFTSDNRLVMSFGSPITHIPFNIAELQGFVCTLEQAIDDEPNAKQRIALGAIKIIFEASLKIAKRDHEEIVSNAPVGADLEEYMLNYANAVKNGEL